MNTEYSWSCLSDDDKFEIWTKYLKESIYEYSVYGITVTYDHFNPLLEAYNEQLKETK